MKIVVSVRQEVPYQLLEDYKLIQIIKKNVQHKILINLLEEDLVNCLNLIKYCASSRGQTLRLSKKKLAKVRIKINKKF